MVSCCRVLNNSALLPTKVECGLLFYQGDTSKVREARRVWTWPPRLERRTGSRTWPNLSIFPSAESLCLNRNGLAGLHRDLFPVPILVRLLGRRRRPKAAGLFGVAGSIDLQRGCAGRWRFPAGVIDADVEVEGHDHFVKNSIVCSMNCGSTDRGGLLWIKTLPPNVPKTLCIKGDSPFSGFPTRGECVEDRLPDLGFRTSTMRLSISQLGSAHDRSSEQVYRPPEKPSRSANVDGGFAAILRSGQRGMHLVSGSKLFLRRICEVQRFLCGRV